MKYLIIITSILILSTPVVGNKHKGETLYLFGEYPDWEWMEFGDKQTQTKYMGQVKNGEPNGLGVLIATNGWKYFGSWKNGDMWNGTEYDNYGNIIYSWEEGQRKYHNLYKSY